MKTNIKNATTNIYDKTLDLLLKLRQSHNVRFKKHFKQTCYYNQQYSFDDITKIGIWKPSDMLWHPLTINFPKISPNSLS